MSGGREMEVTSRQVKIQLHTMRIYDGLCMPYLVEQFPPNPTPSAPVQVLLEEKVTSEFLPVCHLCQTFASACQVVHVL